MAELPCTEEERFTGADPDRDPASYASNSKKKKPGESIHDAYGKGHNLNMDTIQSDAQPGAQGTGEERSEQPTVSINKPSNPRCSPMEMKETLKLPANGCETPADEIPCSFSSPTANVSITIAARTQSSHGNTAQRKRQRKRGRTRSLKKAKDPQAPAQGDQLDNATSIIIGLASTPLVKSSGPKKPHGSSGIKDESNHDSNGEMHNLNDLDMIQCTGEERSEQPTASINKPSNGERHNFNDLDNHQGTGEERSEQPTASIKKPSNGERHNFNNLDMIQGTGEERSEQPTASIKNPSDGERHNFNDLDMIQGTGEERSEQPTASIKNPSNGERHNFNDLHMIQGTGEERNEQPTASIKKPSNAKCSPMKMKQPLKLWANECETPADKGPCSFFSPTAAAQNFSLSIAACTQSSHGNTTGSRRKRGRPKKFKVIYPHAPAQGNQLENATPISVGLESTPLMRSPGTKYPRDSSGIKVRRSNKGTLTGEKRKRGRPQKALVITHATPGSNMEEQQGDKSLQDPAATANGEVMITSSDPQGLPFVKNNTLVWDTIQSMDVFQKTPQNPHFQPLANINDSHREGLAIGYMVTFASVAENTCKLAIDGPRSTIEQLLDTLGDLEPHGFDVEPVRDRLNEMLSYTHKKEELQNLLSKTSGEMEKHTVDKAQIDEEVDDLKKQIAELEGRLSHAISMKEAKEVDLGSVKCRMDEIKEKIAHLCQEYQAFMGKLF